MAGSPEQFEGTIRIAREQGGGLRTNFTKTIHHSSYPAIDPTRPESSQEGRIVLSVGGPATSCWDPTFHTLALPPNQV
ncbi:hypothetical protein VMCG_10373 [Cytospora schulzeri]|uniref:Uncharacterized protein n=1 Tax=Cytospora schulzeri TaxID=448051 RepID=A0A423VCF3_9PEZI|nr:hypothetical protein VMCG_10373 [Valsa malicola]